MGNCQAIDNASLVIQHPTGRVERLYAAVSAAEVMKLNPGHYVALLLTTTLYSSRHLKENNTGDVTGNRQPLRVTRIKLLRNTESLTVGHVYRLVTTKEVMKGLMAKKNGNINNNIKQSKPSEQPTGKHEQTHHQMKKPENDRRKTSVSVKSSAATMKPRGWHPSLNSISEASN